MRRNGSAYCKQASLGAFRAPNARPIPSYSSLIRRSIEITDASRSYVEHARISLAHGERAIRSARETEDRAGYLLEIGKSPDVDPVLVEVLYSIRLPLYFDLEISIHSEPSSDLAHRLMSADLDVALITQPERNAKLTMTKLAETPLHIVLPREHSLASKSAIKLADLRDERWIIYQQRTYPLLYERSMKLMRDEHILGFNEGNETVAVVANTAAHLSHGRKLCAFGLLSSARDGRESPLKYTSDGTSTCSTFC